MRYTNLRLTKIRIIGAAFALTLLAQVAVPLLTPKAGATPLLNTMVRFDRLATGATTTGTVCAKTSAVNGTEGKVDVLFPTGFTLGAFGTFTTNTTNTGWPTGATAWLGIGTATAVNTQDVVFPSSDLATSTLYCFNWANSAAVTTGSAANYTGSITTQTAASAAIDTGNYGVTIVGAGADQVTVTATINPTFSMSLSSATDALGLVVAGSVKSSGSPVQATVSTNAANGWYLWGKDTQTGLQSTTASYTIPSVVTCSGGVSSNSTLAAGTEGYNLGAVVNTQGSGSGGTTSIPAVFNGSSTGRGGGLCGPTSYQTVASSTGTANAAKVDMTNNVAISGVTKPASDYQDIETFVGAGLF